MMYATMRQYSGINPPRKTGAEESTRQVAGWITKRLPALAPAEPVVTAGENMIHFTSM